MLFKPKKFKYKKYQKGTKVNRFTGAIITQAKINLAKKILLIALESAKINSTQLVSLKQTIMKSIKKKGKLKLNIFPNLGISKKPAEIRMGKGKGSIDHWVFKIKKGICICEIDIKLLNVGVRALQLAQYKLPLNTKIIKI